MQRYTPQTVTLDTDRDCAGIIDASSLILDTERSGFLISGSVNKQASIAIFNETFSVIDIIDDVKNQWGSVTTSSAIYVMAYDSGGIKWAPDSILNIGDVIRPVNFSGFLYRITSSGRSGDTEPSWWYPSICQSGAIGTAIAEVFAFCQPSVHGVIRIK